MTYRVTLNFADGFVEGQKFFLTLVERQEQGRREER